MKPVSAPIRFLAGIVALWIGARTWWLLPQEARENALLPAKARADSISSSPTHQSAVAEHRPLVTSLHRPTGATAQNGRASAIRQMDHETVTAIPATTSPLSSAPSAAPPQAPAMASDLPAPIASTSPNRGTTSRWSGSIYLFVRDGGGDALAAGGQLGGGQIGARVAWRLNRDGPARVALAARVYAPLDNSDGAEAAAGVDLYPLPGRPLRLSVERRFDIGGKGRSAWSAYAAGGFWREVSPSIELDGYAQAGIVGAHFADLFADGALRIAYRQDTSPGATLRLGGGAWAGAQPEVERLDIGPRIALTLPIADKSITAAVEGRFRIAGDAAPGSGAALTLAADFL